MEANLVCCLAVLDKIWCVYWLAGTILVITIVLCQYNNKSTVNPLDQQAIAEAGWVRNAYPSPDCLFYKWPSTPQMLYFWRPSILRTTVLVIESICEVPWPKPRVLALRAPSDYIFLKITNISAEVARFSKNQLIDTYPDCNFNLHVLDGVCYHLFFIICFSSNLHVQIH